MEFLIKAIIGIIFGILISRKEIEKIIENMKKGDF